MSVFHNNVLSGAAGQTGGAAAAAGPIKSARFNAGDSAYLNRTPLSAGNRKTWTVSFWVKICKSAGYIYLMNCENTNRFYLLYQSGYITLFNTSGVKLSPDMIFRDHSAWYHMVIAFDTTQSTSTDRLKWYINGVEVSDYRTNNTTYPSQNDQTEWNTATAHEIGSRNGGSFGGIDYYLTDFYFIDGLQKEATDFGAPDDNGVWQAAAYSGSFGTNGFHLLDFENESTVGHDSSGNENDFTANNITSEVTVYSTSATITHDGAADTTYSTGVVSAMFDGSTSTDFGVVNGTSGKFVNIAFASGITVSSTLKVYAAFRNGMVWKVNGNTVSSTGVSHPNTGYQTLNFTGTMNSLRCEVANGNALEIALIEVDGSALIDGDPADLDVLFDVPTNGDSSDDTGAGGELSSNYCVWNALDKNSNVVLTNGNLEASPSGGNWSNVRGTIGVSSGKWYWEIKVDSLFAQMLGVATNSDPLASWFGGAANQGAVMKEDGQVWVNQSSVTDLGSFAAGDIIGIGLDLDGNTIQFYKNGSSMGSAVSITGGRTYFPIAILYASSDKQTANWGQRAFAYGNAGTNRPAATFKALCTSNLPTPTIADGSEYFQASLWTGTGAARSITTTGMSPDFVWIKMRSGSYHNVVFDSVRGATYRLNTNLTNAEDTGAGVGVVSSFNSDGFSLDGGGGNVNQSSGTYVGWAWDAGSSTASNDNGDITSSVRANQTAGFSIVSYTGNGSNSTIGHGLNAAPEMIMIKKRSATQNWVVYHAGIGATKGVYLDSTSAAVTASNFFQNTDPTSSVFSVGTGNGVNTNTETFIAYCFAPVAGYSAFGSYEGNGSTDGPFIHTSMRPAFLLVKSSSLTQPWYIFDAARNTYNSLTNFLKPSSSDAEGSASPPAYFNFLSNGFRVKDTNAAFNQSGATYIYYAVAENPFQANGGLAR